MAILPSTSDTRGRTLASKPLSVSDTARVDGPDTAANEALPLSESNGNVTLSVPPVDVSGLPSDQVSAQNTEPHDFISDSEFWQKMTATLEACFNSNTNDNEPPVIIWDDMLREAPRIMRTFLSHGDACAKIEANALDLVLNGSAVRDDDEPLRAYNEILDKVEQLQETAVSLELGISRLAGTTADQSEDVTGCNESGDRLASSKLAAHSDLQRIFAACLPVLRARVANLTMAQDLIDSAQENLSISLRMEYLGID